MFTETESLLRLLRHRPLMDWELETLEDMDGEYRQREIAKIELKLALGEDPENLPQISMEALRDLAPEMQPDE